MVDPATPDRNAPTRPTINFRVRGSLAEQKYRAHRLADAAFAGRTARTELSQYLQLVAIQEPPRMRQPAAPVRKACPMRRATSMPAAALPYSVGPTTPPTIGQPVAHRDGNRCQLDIGSLRLGDLKLGDINIHVPADKAAFQGDFDFTATKGFILRVSAGVDAQTRIATWLIQAIDPDTGEVMRDATRGLLAPSSDPLVTTTPSQLRGSVSYTVRSALDAVSGAIISAGARHPDDAPPLETGIVSNKLDAAAP
jgi:hypothetical protein